MSANSAIAWTDHTFNPWWGCIHVSPGCEHCYAESFSFRYGHRVWGPAQTTSRRTFGDAHWSEPLKWNAAAESLRKRARVFCASMADVFEDHPGVVASRGRLWALIERTPWLDWLLLTKRPENFSAFLPPSWIQDPQQNVWLGTSVEDEARGLERVPRLVEVPATVHFLSCEPLLGPLDGVDLEGVDWIIVGGESGAGARTLEPGWVHSIHQRCRELGAAFFFKQAGSVLAKEWGMTGKGHDLGAFPEALRVRAFPDTGTRFPVRLAQNIEPCFGVALAGGVAVSAKN